MEIAIGIQFSTRELKVDVDSTAEAIRTQIEEAFADDRRLLWITDTKGRQVAVPVDKLAYVEVDTTKGDKQVGFSRRPED
jgi:hypothetical protein